MDSVRIKFNNGKMITFDCESVDMNVVKAFLADHGDDSTIGIHGLDNIDFELPGRSYVANNGTSLILHRSDVWSIEVV